MKNYLTLLAAACIMLGSACTPKGEDDPVLNVSDTDLVFDAADSAPQSVKVTANVDWKPSVAGMAAEWLTAAKKDDGTLVVSVKENTLYEERSGKIIVEATTAKIKAKEISVRQKAAERSGEQSITVAPEALTFVGEGAPAQQVTVTVTGEGLTWTAAPEEGASWIHVEATGSTLSVSVDDNPNPTPRASNVVVTPNDKTVKPISVKVTQEGKIILPSLSIDLTEEVHFTYNDIREFHINVTAVKTEWSAQASDAEGNPAPWIKLEVRSSGDESFIRISARQNTTLEARSGQVKITASAEGVDPIVIDVTQDAGKEFVSTLTQDVVITDMNDPQGSHNELQLFPNSPGDDEPYYPDPDPEYPDAPVEPIPGRRSAKWDLFIWGNDITYDQSGYPYFYTGNGNRMKLDIRSERILHNYDDEYYLPDGEYTIVDNEDELPNTITYGQDVIGGDEIFPRGSWYYRMEGGTATAAAPLVGGKLTVSRSGDIYTLTFDFVDDAGNKITGTATVLFNMNVLYTPPEDDPIGGGGGEV